MKYNYTCNNKKDNLFRNSNGFTDDRIDLIFPEDTGIIQQLEIPLDVIQKLNAVRNVTDLFEQLIDFGHSISARLGDNPEEDAVFRAAEAAHCMPELRTISIEPKDDSSSSSSSLSIYYPQCTRVRRCGGCCSHRLLTCQPTEVEIKQLGVLALEYFRGNQLRFKGQKVIQIEEHRQCKCDCKVQAKDCARYQSYNPKKCSCECRNLREEAACLEKRRKLWNHELCSCMCKEEIDCGTGFYFDPYQCKCIRPIQKYFNSSKNSSNWFL